MRCQGWAKEGRHGALWEVMIGMEYLLNFFEEQNLIFSSPDSSISELRNFRVSATKRSSAQRIEQGRGREKHLPQHAREEYTDVVLQDENLDDDHRRCVQISIKNCWSKLDEYYSLLGQSPLYPAAVILHPRWNVSWLEANWTSDEQLVWLRDAKNSVREFFEQHYPREEQPETSRTVTGKAVRQDEPSQFDQWMQSCDRCMMEEEDELGVYMRQGPVRRENLNPVLWWKDHQEEYPRLSKFALDILAIPAMSVDPERTFSVTKLTRCSHLPKAAKTIRSWVMDAFRSKKQRLREDLRQARSRISISFDLWTSPNPYAVLGVIAMWIDTAGKRQTTVLGIRRVYGEHTGENIGSVILELLREYDVGGDQIGYFMLDNASSNDTAVEFILKELCPWMTPKQRRHRRLRCLGHIINLCCQAFLMGRDCERYLAKLEKHYQRGDYAKVEELWKRFGCLGRLHNLVRYIRLTPQRREEFAAIIVGGDLAEFDRLELIQNNSTRWNSWFHSITRALNVRERLEIFSARHVPGKGSHGIANFKLDGQHWFELEKIELALKDFYAATLLSEGKKTSLADWFSTLDCLLREINETKDHYDTIDTEDDNNFTWKYLQGCADAAWSKCEEYYSNQQLNWQNRFPEDTDLPPAYYAAQILDPYRKWAWFRQEWVLQAGKEKQKWFDNAQSAVKQLWETEYKGRYAVEMLPPPVRKERYPDPAFDRQREHKRIRIDAPVSAADLYEQYISTDRLHDDEAGCDEAIAYWLSRYDSQRDLARFALDLFAISPMSDECERLFSSAKLTIVDRRGRLKADIIEACECLRAWYGKPRVEENNDSEDSENDDDWVTS
ncbi:putative AC transposase [Fusarium oxysporum f. sp. rapae]|uniref:Putative AC transposase n=1 Tax=Fusarium oxysporum f. sp. rapae TaxID=485398 RepID=A0A8J5NH79_FUSOX|nr:putative AC transposase [Fusarium oxysporum f. sp. rapae]